jgi:hypothetical protein
MIPVRQGRPTALGWVAVAANNLAHTTSARFAFGCVVAFTFACGPAENNDDDPTPAGSGSAE